VKPRPEESAEIRERCRADNSFDALTAALVVERTRVAAWIGLTIFPSFALLDWAVYPEHAAKFLTWRLACALVMLLVAGATRLRLGAFRLVPAYSAYLTIGMAIAAMVHETGGAGSPYYVGLCLVALSTVLVMPWRTRHTVGACATLYLAYVSPSVLLGSTASMGQVVTSHFFLLASGLIAAIGTHLAYRNRRRQFDLTWALDKRSGELAHANEQLRELDTAKARFFANVSHELRTPLTLMLTPLETAMERPMAPELRDELGMFQTAASRLATLIDGLLDIAEIDSGGRKLRKSPLRLDLLAREVVMAARPFAKKHRITLELGCAADLPAAMLDRSAIEQVLYNLVSNALKFTPRGGTVEVGVREGTAGDLLLCVTDDGPGIPAERLAALFERFGHKTETAHATGSGLGLSLVKEHAHAHGGSVQVFSEVGAGTRFEVRLPLGAPRAEMLAEGGIAPLSDRSNTSQRRALNFSNALAERSVPGERTFTSAPVRQACKGDPRVLVIDDDREMRILVARCLADSYQVIEASDGAEGLAAVEEFDPDVIVSDIGMPHVDGIEFCRRLRKLPGGDRIPLIFLTARAGSDPRLEGLEQGANDYLTKPFSKRELRARVKNFAALRKAERSLAKALDAERETRADLVKSEKFAELGRMAIEVGHEINNPLNFVINDAKRLKRDAEGMLAQPPGDALPKSLVRFPDLLARVVDGGERIKRIVQGLRSLSAKPDRNIRAVDVDKEVHSILRLFEGDLPAGVRIEHNALPKGETALVIAPQTGVGQVLTNLLSNAIKAVTPSASEEAPTVIWVRTALADDGRSVVIAVEDEGCGMDEETAARVFDPFFTTRQSGEGLGVGMALVKRIVHDEIGGAVSFETEPDRGTAFRVTLPLQGSEPDELAA
jgi:signal transduction histidine kinase